ncbi:hypothetical protein BGX27_001733 [Mortierella sp. AM989]|nr:hypothetical protein BGX27_001733 [Mortierella sp. AM989]
MARGNDYEEGEIVNSEFQGDSISLNNRSDRHHDQFHGNNNNSSNNNNNNSYTRFRSSISPPRNNHSNTNHPQHQWNNNNNPRNNNINAGRAVDHQRNNYNSQSRNQVYDDSDRSRKRQMFSADDNGDRNEMNRRGSSPYHRDNQQLQRKALPPQDEVIPGSAPRKIPQDNRYQQQQHYNGNNSNNSNSNNSNSGSRARTDSLDQSFDPRRSYSTGDKKSREGNGSFAVVGQRSSTGNNTGGFNHNNNNNSRYRNNSFQNDYDDHVNNRHHNNLPYNGNRGRHYNVSPKRSSSNSSTSSHHVRGNNFRSPTPDTRSPRERSRTPQISPGRRHSQTYGRRDDRDGDYHGYRHGNSPTRDQDIHFDNRKRRRSTSPFTSEAQLDSFSKREYNPYNYPGQGIKANEWDKAPHQEHTNYPSGTPLTSMNSSLITVEHRSEPSAPLPTLNSLTSVLPLLMQLQQQKQLSIQQPPLPHATGVNSLFTFPVPPPPPPIPPLPPTMGGIGLVPGIVSPVLIPPQQQPPGSQYTIASAMIPPATHTTMSTVSEAANADPTKGADKSKEQTTRSTNRIDAQPIGLLATSGAAPKTSLNAISDDNRNANNKSIKKEAEAEEGLRGIARDLGKGYNYQNAHKQQHPTTTSAKDVKAITSISIKPEETIVYAVPSIVGSDQSKQGQAQRERGQPALPPQPATESVAPNSDPLAAILSDPLTARLLETIQPFLAQRVATTDSSAPNATSLDSKQETVKHTTQDTLQGTAPDVDIARGAELDITYSSQKQEIKHADKNSGAAVDVNNRISLYGASEAMISVEASDSSLKSKVQRLQDQADQVLSKAGKDEEKTTVKHASVLDVKEDKETNVKHASNKPAQALISSDNKVSSSDNQGIGSTEGAILQGTMLSNGTASVDVLSVLEPSKDIKLPRCPSPMAADMESDMDISSDEDGADHIVIVQKSVNTNVLVKDKGLSPSSSSSSTKLVANAALGTESRINEATRIPASDLTSNVKKDIAKNDTSKAVAEISTGYQVESEPTDGMCDMDVDGPQTVPDVKLSSSLRVSATTTATTTATTDAASAATDSQSEQAKGDRTMKRRQRSCSSPSLSSSQIGASTQQSQHNQRQQQSKPSWHFALGSDLALLSEMAASNADLNRFRRESVWLEERVRRPRRDVDSENVLDKALGLTRSVPHPNQENRGRNNSNGGSGVTDSEVRLSSESRVAFSILKTNLLSDLEEQTRLETDYQTLQRALERMQVKIVEKQKLQMEAEQQIQEVVNRQSELELELQRVREQEAECLRQRELQRKQAEEEIRHLEATLLRLQQQTQQQQGQGHQEQRLLQT